MTPPVDDAETSPGDAPLQRNREYLAWLCGDIAAGFGAGIGTFAFPLIAFAVTGSTAATGLVGLVQGLGLLLGLIPGGVIADRFDRRRLRMLSGATGAALHLLLVAVLLSGVHSAVVLAALASVNSFRGALFSSASNAMLKQLVPPKQLAAAKAVDQGRDAVIELVSAPLGGLLLAWHLALPVVAQVLGSLINLVSTLLMRGQYRSRAEDAECASAFADLREGVRWMTGHRVRVQIVTAATLLNLGSNGALLAMMLMLAADGVPAVRIGLLTTAFATALLAGAIAAPRVVAQVPTGVIITVQLLVIAVVTAMLPLLPELWMIALAYAVMGAGLGPLNAAIMGFFMHITPNNMQGRAEALTGLLAMGLMPLAPALAGWGLENWGPAVTLGIFAALCAAGAMVVLVGGPARRIPVSSRWEEFSTDELP